jgi:spore maturation protein CgeB
MEMHQKKPRVLCLMDEFSYFCFFPEFERAIPIRLEVSGKDLYDLVRNEAIDFFFCESCWNSYPYGYNIGDAPWWVRKKRMDQMRNITVLLKKMKIPTIFWNKEDNKHFKTFLPYASLFDYIFTTDARTLGQYKAKCPKSIANVLIFAAQPIIHNPIGLNLSTQMDGDVLFAGRWYPFRERMIELNELLTLPQNIKLHIYDRSYTKRNPTKFPKKFHHRIRQGVGYREIVKKYKKYPIMINANSVKNSPTMFSRRVPEALACGVSVISSPDLSLRGIFGDSMDYSSDKTKTLRIVGRLLTQTRETKQRNHVTRRLILQKHTYFQRVQQICETLKIEVPQKKKGVAILYLPCQSQGVNRDHGKEIEKQNYSDVQLKIPLCFSGKEIERILRDLFLGRIYNKKHHPRLGFVAITNPVNIYEENYITDQILSFHYLSSEIDMVGKASFFSLPGTKQCFPELEQTKTSVNNLHPDTMVYSLACDPEKKEIMIAHVMHLMGVQCGKSADYFSDNLKAYSTDCYNFFSSEKDNRNQ